MEHAAVAVEFDAHVIGHQEQNIEPGLCGFRCAGKGWKSQRRRDRAGNLSEKFSACDSAHFSGRNSSTNPTRPHPEPRKLTRPRRGGAPGEGPAPPLRRVSQEDRSPLTLPDLIHNRTVRPTPLFRTVSRGERLTLRLRGSRAAAAEQVPHPGRTAGVRDEVMFRRKFIYAGRQLLRKLFESAMLVRL